MKPTWLEVRDFRAFPYARLELPASGLVFVAGVTKSGKGALLMRSTFLSTDPSQILATSQPPAQRKSLHDPFSSCTALEGTVDEQDLLVASGRGVACEDGTKSLDLKRGGAREAGIRSR